MRYRRVREATILVVCGSATLLIRVPHSAGPGIAGLVPLAVLGGATALALRESRPNLNLTLAAALAFGMVTGVSLLRAANVGLASWTSAFFDSAIYILLVLFGWAVAGGADRGLLERRLAALALSPGIYCIFSALLQLAGITREDRLGVAAGQQASLAEWVGLSVERVHFALATGVNSMGIAAALGVVGAGILLVRGAAPLWATVPTALASAYCAVLSDTRVSLFLAVIAIAYFGWGRRRLAIRWIALAVPLLPLAFVWLLTALRGSWLETAIARQSGEFATGNGRVEIWQGAWRALQDGGAEILVGWGARGQVTSGASANYAYVFSGYPNPLQFSAHNVVLQTLLDTGVLGLALLTLCVFLAASALQGHWRGNDDSAAVAILACMLVAVFSGVTEISPSYAIEEALVMTLLAFGAAGGLATRAVEPSSGRLKDLSRPARARPAALGHRSA